MNTVADCDCVWAPSIGVIKLQSTVRLCCVWWWKEIPADAVFSLKPKPDPHGSYSDSLPPWGGQNGQVGWWKHTVGCDGLRVLLFLIHNTCFLLQRRWQYKCFSNLEHLHAPLLPLEFLQLIMWATRLVIKSEHLVASQLKIQGLCEARKPHNR